jgi:hypothetical protein
MSTDAEVVCRLGFILDILDMQAKNERRVGRIQYFDSILQFSG